MSALPPKADIGTRSWNVCFVPKADICSAANLEPTLLYEERLPGLERCVWYTVTFGKAESGRAETTMRLTLHTDFALRTLIQVGLNDGKLTTINDIAQSFDISKAHLMKVVNDLSQMGYLDTVRGRNGGIRLMREPRHINIGQVVRDTEDQLDVIGCIEHKGYCPIERVCVLRSALRDATQAFLAVLDTYSLADLIKPRKALSSILFGLQHLDHSVSR